ncbi:MAG: SDR family NAD(P)-dependent oxidoreductase [Clostridia bacterium]|nr:SDR family NAD(P)-dependent oxidoreductase [Clostridia bacterium]
MAEKVCVITGGGSGMGLVAAKILGKDRIIVLSGRTEKKLENAVNALKELGITAYAKSCDTSKRDSVKGLVEFASSIGQVTTVINSAGLSPTMADPETIYKVNALGTVYINQEFSKVMGKGSVIVDIASMAAYQLSAFLLPTKSYPLADTDEELFMKKMMKRAGLAKKDAYQYAGLAYSISKNFVTWYAKKSAFEFGEKGIRVVSLSPGLIATGMGKAETESGAAADQINTTCEKRMGTPEGLGYAIATVADERNEYLNAVDVLVDGGCIAGLKEFRKKK